MFDRVISLFRWCWLRALLAFGRDKFFKKFGLVAVRHIGSYTTVATYRLEYKTIPKLKKPRSREDMIRNLNTLNEEVKIFNSLGLIGNSKQPVYVLTYQNPYVWVNQIL